MVKIILLRIVLKLYCVIKCGGYVINNKINKSGIIGIFGKMCNLVNNDIEWIVVFLFFNFFSDGDIVSLLNGEYVGVCCWLVKLEFYRENFIDVFIVEIDFIKIDMIKRVIFNECILVEDILYEDFDY